MSVNTDAVNEAGRMAHALACELIDALKAADADVDALLASGWSGHAATSYETAWRRVLDSGIDLIGALVDSAQLLGVAATDYATQDDASANRLSVLNLG
ncbi:WXG100 family type VII secretion target [Rhodococcus sp. NPDC003322]